MSETGRALDLLAELSASDRDWIVQRLSATARERLIEPQKSRTDSGPDAEVHDRIARSSAEQVSTVLRTEPAWVVCSVLSAYDWPWSKQLLHELPPAHRAEIVRLQRHGVTLSKPAMQVLLRGLADRIGHPAFDTAPAPRSRFETVLARLRRPRHA
jgi:hypothetical protein